MDRFVLTDAQWEKMEPHCLGKRSDPGRTGGDILPKPKELLQRRRPLFRANSGFSASLLEGMLAEPAQGICFANGPQKSELQINSDGTYVDSKGLGARLELLRFCRGTDGGSAELDEG
jgi:hypothetical protein